MLESSVNDEFLYCV